MTVFVGSVMVAQPTFSTRLLGDRMCCKKRLVRRDELGDFIGTDRQMLVLRSFSLPLDG